MSRAASGSLSGALAALLLAGCAAAPAAVVTRVETRWRTIPAAFLDCGPAPLLAADPASAGDLGLHAYALKAWGQGCAWRLGCVASLQAGEDACGWGGAPP